MLITKYFCWLDGDGEIDTSYLENMYKIVLENQKINIVNASRFKNKNIIIEGYGLISSILTIPFNFFVNFFSIIR